MIGQLIKKFLGLLDNSSEKERRELEFFRKALKREKTPCTKDPSKMCPLYHSLTVNGVIHAHNVSACCKIQDDMKRQRENIAKLEPGVNYGGVTFTKEVIESCRLSVERDKRRNIENDND